MGVSCTVAIEVELSGVGGGWTDITADVVASTIRVQYGLPGSSPLDRVASAGSMLFQLHNGEWNSGTAVGYYSPGHTNARSGWAIGIGCRLKITYNGTDYYKFRGTVETIKPMAGQYGSKRVSVEVVDWMDEAAKAKTSGLSIQTDQRSDEVFQTLTTGIAKQPAAVSVLKGTDVYPYALDNVRDEQISVLSEFQKLAQSEFGYIYVKGDTIQGGTLVHEGRRARGLSTTNDATFSDSELFALTTRIERANVLNRIQAVVHPRRVDSTTTGVLFSLESVPKIIGNTSQTFRGPYRDPSQRAVRIGGIEMVTPASTTDFLLTSSSGGGGTNLTANLTVTFTDGGNAGEFIVTNTGTQDGYLTKLQCRGKGVYDYETILVEAESTSSQDTYGESLLTLDMAYQTDVPVAQDAAYYILNLNSSQGIMLDSVGFLANASSSLMDAAMMLDISSRVGISETVTGVNASYYINAVELSIKPPGIVRCSWTVMPADSNTYWILNSTTYSVLDSTTKLSYGLWNNVEDASWTGTSNCTATANSLEKTSTGDWGNSGAITAQTVSAGDCYVRFSMASTTAVFAAGLSNGNTNSSYSDIDFAIYLTGSTAYLANVYEAGIDKSTGGGSTSYVAGDILRVGVESGAVKYYKNDTLFYTSTGTPTYPLLVDTALYSSGDTLSSGILVGPWSS